MAQPKEYKAIAAWGRFLHSFQPYITDQQELAARDKAPLDAIFKREDGWHRLSEVTNTDTLYYFRMNHPELLTAEQRGEVVSK